MTITPVSAEHALLVSGPIGADFEASVRASLERYPDTRVLVMRSPGGVRHQALKVAELVNQRGLTVRIDGRCASACALLWAAAQSREMTASSKLGLHASRLNVPLPLPNALETRINARNDRQTDEVLRNAGFPARIIAAGGRTPPTSMSWFDPVELQRGGVPFTLRERTQPTTAASVASQGLSHVLQR